MSSGGCPPSGAEYGEVGHTGATQGAGIADLAYRGLGDFVPPHSRALSTTPSTCYALCDFNGCCKQFHFISFHFLGLRVVFFALTGVGLFGFLGVGFVFGVFLHERLVAREV